METERGSFLLDLESILFSCPIEVNNQDDYDSLTRKIADFLQKTDTLVQKFNESV